MFSRVPGRIIRVKTILFMRTLLYVVCKQTVMPVHCTKTPKLELVRASLLNNSKFSFQIGMKKTGPGRFRPKIKCI
jgi:hypothetical protein